MIERFVKFCLENKPVVFLLLIIIITLGISYAPFGWNISWLPSNPIPVDAIPDIGENQQIVFTEWAGRSPQDVEDQVTYPLTVSLLGIPEVKTIRSYSFFGFSTIYIIFNDKVDFYWSRTRVLEKLNSMPPSTLPNDTKPTLGPDATALGQVFWYTLEGRDKFGNPTGGWDLDELRSIQDWYVRFALQSTEGVSEVSSVGGAVKEFQIDVDPDAMRTFNVSLNDVYDSVRVSNIDVGARTIEINKVEYLIRGLGFLKSIEDIEESVITVRDNVPIKIKNVAHVSIGPAYRRGALDKEGAEAVGGVIVVRYGENPLEVIKRVKKKIAEISPGLPQKTLPDGTVSQINVIPFYDRTGLIEETLGTLENALILEILITAIVVVLMVNHLRSALLISGLLPLSVLMCFIAMKWFGVDANIVALSGIAIAIGTMVDMGIVICENILRNLEEEGSKKKIFQIVLKSTREVGSAVITAVATTVISFLPVFTMEASEGKLFIPLAYTKTFALLASIIVAIMVLPVFAALLFDQTNLKTKWTKIFTTFLIFVAALLSFKLSLLLFLVLIVCGLYYLSYDFIPEKIRKILVYLTSGTIVAVLLYFLARQWMPLGFDHSFFTNYCFVISIIGSVFLVLRFFQKNYEPILRWCIANKLLFLSIPTLLIFIGLLIWLGTDTFFESLPKPVKNLKTYSILNSAFPGLGREFMPPLDEGSYLYMPTTMPHASIGECLDVLQKLDKAIAAIPEVNQVVGKIGRVESPLDPAPISMVETIINYKSEYILNKHGYPIRYQFNANNGEFVRDEKGCLIPSSTGKPFRQWRDHIRSADDIWEEITNAAQLPGTTSAPKLQPISARIVMLQSGMRAPMGVKVKGPDLETIEKVSFEIEKYLKEVPSVRADTVVADRIVGKPYVEIAIDRKAIARHGIKIQPIQQAIEIAIGGQQVTTFVDGRERYPVRVRYMRELRDRIETLGSILIPDPTGIQIPLRELSEINYVIGPQMIKSEDTFLVSYVPFDKKASFAEVNVVDDCQKYLQQKLDSGEFVIPKGCSYEFAGNYTNQIRSEKKLRIVLPLALLLIALLLYLQFRSIRTTLILFSGVLVAWSGGFIMIWMFGQPWFLNFSLFGINLRDLFQIHPLNLSVAVWVGFLALFGIATDDGVIIATYIKQAFEKNEPSTVQEVRELIVQSGLRRIRPCLMTSATTILALIPILTSTGRGSDVMIPMAIPSIGGMTIVLITVFVVPVLYSFFEEAKIKQQLK